MPILIIDSSELSTKLGASVKEYFEKHGHTVMVKPAQADYVFSDQEGKTVCVERTNPSDFYSKLTSGRLWEQLDHELLECDKLYYVVAGYRDYGYMLKMASKDIDSSLTGALTSIAKAAILVPIWFDYKFPHWLLVTFEKEVGEREPSRVGRTPRKAGRTPFQIAVDLLTTLPHVGVKKAEDIAREFKTIKQLLKALCENPLPVLSKHLPLKHAKEIEELLEKDIQRKPDEKSQSF